jgi:hypothetical protein
MCNYKDLTNKKFGRLRVLYRVGTAKNRTPLWRCVCECGNRRTVRSNHLVEGHTSSCGCLQRDRVKEIVNVDLVGRRFNRLMVIKKLNKRKQRAIMWLCECDCGSLVEVKTSSLINGHTKSCGCYHFDKIWKGGLSYEPYCAIWSFKEFKEMIKYRDGNRCLITICRSCNARANYNRIWYESWYKAILSKRYGYVYY